MATSSLPLSRAEEDADVAFALETVPWVRAVYVVDDPREGQHRYLIHLTLEGTSYGKAEVHYALIRARGRRDSADVELAANLPPLGRYRRLELSPSAREAARARARTAFLPEVLAEVYGASLQTSAPRAPRRAFVSPVAVALQVLIIDDDPETERVARAAFPASARIVVCPYRETALALLSCWSYDRIVVSDTFALGEGGILPRLLDADSFGNLPVVLLAPSDRADRADRALAAKNRTWKVLVAPLHEGVLAESFGSTVRGEANAPRAAEALLATLPADHYAVTATEWWPPTVYALPERRGLKVLVVDDDPETERVARGVFPFPDEIVLCPFRETAIALMMCWSYDRVLVAESFAFGDDGVLGRLFEIDSLGITPLVVLASPAHLVEAMGVVAAANRPWQVLSSPVDAITLSTRFGRAAPVDVLARAGRSATQALLGPRGVTPSKQAAPAPLPTPLEEKKVAVLIVDASLEAVDAKLGAKAHLDVTIATGYWAAIDELRTATFDTMLCDASARHDGHPLYRELWDLFPGLMARTVLVTSAEAAAALEPRVGKKGNRVVARPLTAARLVAAVRSFHGV